MSPDETRRLLAVASSLKVRVLGALPGAEPMRVRPLRNARRTVRRR